MDLGEGFTTPHFLRERISANARNIRIEVRPDGEVRLIIPQRVSRRLAYDFLDSRKDWIRAKLDEMGQRRADQPDAQTLAWDGTDSLPLHGVPTPLLVLTARAPRPMVRFGEQIQLYCPARMRHDHAALARTMRDAMRRLARSEARRVLDEEAPRIDAAYSGPRIADQKSLWGSCSPDGLISLNWRLVMAPREVMRYVAVHEVCHLRHLDHSKRFWSLVARQMPDFETWRSWLRQHGAELHRVLPRAQGTAEPLDLLDTAPRTR